MADNVFVHPQAWNESQEVGGGTRIWGFAHVMAGARIGKNCNIGEHCFLERGAILGNGVTLKNGVCVWEGVLIEDYAFIGPFVALTNDRNPRSPRLEADSIRRRYAGKEWLVPTRICQGASLGANATIVCGTTIGRFAMVAAGAVVTRSVGDHELVAGSPARPIGAVCLCGQKMQVDGIRGQCRCCGAGYVRTGGIWQSAG